MKSSLFLEFPANEKQNCNWNRRTAASTGNPRSHSILIFFLLDIKKVNRSKKRSNIFSEYLLSVGKTEKWAESSAFSLELVFCFKVRRFSFLFIVFFFVVVQFSFRFVSPTHRRKKKWKKKTFPPFSCRPGLHLGHRKVLFFFFFFLIFSYFFLFFFLHFLPSTVLQAVRWNQRKLWLKFDDYRLLMVNNVAYN